MLQILSPSRRGGGAGQRHGERQAEKIERRALRYRAQDARFRLRARSVARAGKEATVALPGGCVIGDRPIDLAPQGLRGARGDDRIEGGNMKVSPELNGASSTCGGNSVRRFSALTTS